jgi:hypothetical protein
VSLRSIVKTVGGELLAGGAGALIPAPGHSEADRSVSLRLRPDGRVLVNCFSPDTQWADVFDWLRGKGLVDQNNKLTSAAGNSAPRATSLKPEPTARERIAAARRIWDGGVPITGTLAARHFALRHVGQAVPLIDPNVARFRQDTPVAPYIDHPNPYRQPALLVAIRDQAGALTGIEVTFLAASGKRAANLKVNRKMVGSNPPSSAMRIMPAQPTMLVAEGFFTTLSACKLLGRPGWALGSMRNLVTWEPPEGVRDVLIAGDRGPGEQAAASLKARLIAMGLTASINIPPAPYGDWNDYDAALAEHACAQGPTDSLRRLIAEVTNTPLSPLTA